MSLTLVSLKKGGNRVTVAAGQYSDVVYSGDADTALTGPITIEVMPDSGGTCTVFYTLSTVAEIKSDEAEWTAWPEGAASEKTDWVALGSVMGFRAQAVAQPAKFTVLRK